MKEQSTRQIHFRGKVVDMTTESIQLPNGKQLLMDIVVHPGGAAVVALDDSDQVCLLRQYRGAIDEWVWELPAGKIDHREPAQETARRELMEEVGLHAKHWHTLGHVISSPGVFTEKVYLYLATGLSQHASQQEEHEVFEIHWLPLADSLQWCMDGSISDAKSVAGLLRADHFLQSLS